MNRRRLLQGASGLWVGHLGARRSAIAAQTPAATPEFLPPDEAPLDTRARELVDRLRDLPPGALLDALLAAEVSDPLLEAAGDATPTTVSWHDTSDFDLEHALGGVLIVTNDASVNSPELSILGNFIVYESAEIAYDQLMRQEDKLHASGMSISVAGGKVWITGEGEEQIGLMRIGNVFVVGDMTRGSGVMEGMVMHLDMVARMMS